MKFFFNSPYIIRTILINIYGFYLSFRRFNKHYYSFYDYIINNESKSDAVIKSEQIRKLKEVLIYSYENIEYYRSLFDENNFIPYNFNSTDQLSTIPILTRQIISNNFNTLYNKKINKSTYAEHATSGSTGEKCRFYIPYKLLYAQNAAFSYKFYRQLNIKKGDKRVTIGGRIFTEKKPYWIHNYIENQLLLSSHHLNDLNAVNYLNKIKCFRPDFIQGHPNSILYLAKSKINTNIKFNFQLKGIFTTGEILLEDDREIIEQAFNCIVLQQYGSGESCFSAYETVDKDGYKINYEHGYIELVGDAEFKEVLATSFLNPVMPLIRYKVGDLVMPSNKGGLFLFESVIGRIDDIITDDEGNDVLPVSLRMIMKKYLKDGTNYQLIQNEIGDYSLSLKDHKKTLDVDIILHSLKKVLGKNSVFKISYNEKLMTKGGKLLNIIDKRQNK